MPVRVEVAPALLGWAVERSGRDPDDLRERFPRLEAWERGEARPTLKQLEAFSRATYAPIGTLLLPSPPQESLPVPDFRTLRDEDLARPSPNLLDTLYLCEQRQEWYRDFARSAGQPGLGFVGSLTSATAPVAAADAMRPVLGFELAARREFSSWTEALRGLTERAEEAGVLVMVSGVVGSNTHRKLDPDEFRGFALIDQVAPLIFINGADSKSAQIFTLAHELAHVWRGESALSNPNLEQIPQIETERWCNEVAAELLVPLTSIREELSPTETLAGTLARLARLYKVSTLVILRRVFDAGVLSWEDYRSAFGEELARVLEASSEATGGSFYNTQPARVSKRFARAVIADTLEGRTLRRDAFRLLGFRKAATFDELGHRLGVT